MGCCSIQTQFSQSLSGECKKFQVREESSDIAIAFVSFHQLKDRERQRDSVTRCIQLFITLNSVLSGRVLSE